MENKIFDVLIVGAGPGGCATAISLSNSGLKVALIDKAIFPREKICGDGITLDSISQLSKLSPRMAKNVKDHKSKINCQGYLISDSNGTSRFIKIPKGYQNYIIEREYFDNELIKECKQYQNINVFENTKAIYCNISEKKVKLTTTNGSFIGDLIVGADGANSLIAKMINPNRSKESINGLSVRAYFKNVKDNGHKDVIEIHYLKELLPGYLWIFHLSNNKKNVGIGMDERVVKKNKLNLGKIFHELIENSPQLKWRFENATMIGALKAHRLPVFNRYKKIYENRVLLVGDAANVINPLTGEGVGNALRTGRFAAEHIKECFNKNTFTKEFNKAYFEKVKLIMFSELNMYGIFARINKVPWLASIIIKSDFICGIIAKIFIKHL